ncbi:MAG: hypothetical protein H6605_05250 [Flavobacteriales bacterium]|nr:hypothetical protein [Flavobacteriales bacterium]
MQRTNEKIPILILLKKFIYDTEKGKRLQKNGSLISKSTIENYHALLNNLSGFCIKTQNNWPFNIKYKASKSNFNKEKRYYKRFYTMFTTYMYTKGCTDNYVGMQIKVLRTFFIYQITAEGHEMGTFFKDFYVRREEIPIIVLSQEQLRFLINDREFENSLSATMKIVKDIFVVGCTIGLRFSDLMSLKLKNIVKQDGATYIIKISKKTNAVLSLQLST